MIFWIVIGIFICQRLIEVLVAKRNEKKVKAIGAIEFGASHYPYMVAMHAAFSSRLLERHGCCIVNRLVFSYCCLCFCLLPR